LYKKENTKKFWRTKSNRCLVCAGR